MALLLEDHGYIRRPLLQVGQRREVGFLAAVVADWIGLDPVEPPDASLEGCTGAGGHCGPPGPAPVQLGRPRAG